MNIFDPSISGSLSVSGSGQISGDLTILGTLYATVSGTTENAVSASHAASYTLTSSFHQHTNSFNTFTSSYTTGSFTGSFSGNGAGLSNIPASGVTGLNLTRIADGSATASISQTNGLRINTNTELTGSLKISNINLGVDKVILVNVTDSGGKYFIDGVRNPVLSLIKGFTYRFLYPNITSHPFRFSTTNDGSHNGGSIYSVGVTTGSGPDYIQIEVTDSTPSTLYYYCTAHPGMGNSIGVYSDLLNVEADRQVVHIDPSRIATTGSNTFIGTETISGSLSVTGSVNITGSISLNGQAIGTGKLDEVVFNSYTSSNDTTNSLQNGRLDSLETTTSSLNTFSSSTNSKLSSIEISTGSLNSFTSSANSSLNAIHTATSSLNSYTSSNNTNISAIHTATSSLNSYTSSNNTNISAIHTTTSSLNTFSSSILGAVEVTGSNLTIKGNLLVKGTTTQIDSTTLNIGDNIISLNGTATNNAGLVVQDASGASTVSGSLLWDTATDFWKAGKLGAEERIILVNEYNIFSTSIDSRASSLQTTTSSLNSYTSSNNTNITAIHTATSSLNTFTSSANGRLNSLEITTGSLNTYTSSTNTRIGVIETTTGSLNTYTSSTNTRLGVIESTTSSLNTFTSSANNRLNSLETASGSIRTDFNSYTSSNDSTNTTQNSRLGTLETTTGSLNTYTSSTNTRLGVIESTTSSLNSYTSSTNTRLNNIETSTGSLNTFTSSTNSRLSSLETASGSIRTDFNSYTSSNNSTNTTQNSRLSSLETTTGSLNTYTSSNTTNINAIHTATSSLNSYTSSTNTRLGIIESTTSSLNSYTSSTNTRLGIIETSTGSLNTYTSSTNTRLGVIESTTSSLNSYTTSNNSNINAIHTATSSLNSFTSSINTTIKNRLNTEGVISGSVQVTLSSTTGYSTFSSSLATTDLGQDNRLTSLEGKTGSYATTGSNTFIGNQTITGSLYVSQDLIIAGSSSIQHISSSVVNIADNIITVNAQNPSIRFGGLAVIDSGSSPQVSGSILFDSVNNQWIFVHQNQSTITSSVLLMGPETFNNLGGETYLTQNRIPKGSGIEHLRDSNITDTGTKVSINSNTEITGTFITTGNISSPNITAIETSTSSLNSYTSALKTAIELTGSNLTVKGDLLVKGTTTNVNTTTLNVDNNLITLNGTGATSAGIRVRDTTAPNLISGSLLWDATNDYWVAGQLGSEQRLVRETEFNNAVSRVGSLETSTASLNTYTSSTNTRLGVIESTTSSLNLYTSSTNNRLSSIETSTGSLNTFTSSAGVRLSSLETASGSIRTDFNSFTSSNNTTNNTQNSRLTAIESTTGSLNSYTSSNNTNITAIHTATSSLNSYTSSTNSRLSSIETATSSLNTYTSSNNTTNNTQNSRLTAIETTTGSLNSYTSSNTTNINAIHTATSSLNSYTSSNNTNISAIHTATSSLNSYTSSNTTNINAIHTATASLNSFTSSAGGRLTSIEGVTGSIASLNTYTGSNNTVIGTLQATTSSLNSYTSSNTTNINAIHTATSSLNTFTNSFNSAFSLSGADVTVRGNFIVSGTTTTVNSTTVNIADNIIQLNGSGATNAGIIVRDATSPTTTSGSLFWDTTNDKWIAGPSGAEDDIVLRTATQTLTNKTINASQLVDASVTNAKLANSSFNIGTTSISLGRTSSAQTLSGVSIDGTVTKTITAGNAENFLYANVGTDDYVRIRGGSDGYNTGWIEIATSDDGTEPIFVRQYSGVFTTVARTATLLDASGNTSFPGTINGLSVSGGTITSGTWNGTAIGNAYLANSSFFVGTTSISLGRASALQTLTGVSIDGNAATVTDGAYLSTANTFTGQNIFSNTSTDTLILRNTEAMAQDRGSYLTLQGNDGLTSRAFGQIAALKENGTSGNYAGKLILYVRPNGVALTPAITISSSTNVAFAGTITSGTWNGTSISTTYTDAKVTSVTGTTNQITASSSTGAITLSLPQNIHTSASPTFNRITTSGLYGNSTTGNIPIWQYDSSNTGYGIVYNESSPDTLRIDVSGQALTGTPDVLIGPDYIQVNGNTVYHAGNIPTWNQNTTGTASNITAFTINQNVGSGNTPTFAGLTVGAGVATGRSAWGAFTNANIILTSSASDSTGNCGIEFRSGNNYPSDGASIYFENNASGGASERAKLTIRVENDQEDFMELRGGRIDINSNTISGGGQSTLVNFQSAGTTVAYITSGGAIYARSGNLVKDFGNSTFTTSFTNVSSVTVTHNLGSKDVMVMCYDSADEMFWPSSIVTTSTSVVTITFAANRTGRVVVLR